jgi:transcriptional regulator GlxA family with amidase domain
MKKEPITQVARAAYDKHCEAHLFTFVLLDGFSHLSLVSALETLQTANLVAGSQIYDWKTCGLSDGAVRSSVGLVQPVDGEVRDVTHPKDIVIVSGEGAFETDLGGLKVWLARVARGQTRVTGLGTGSIIMARTGLLDGKSAAVHPWYRTGFTELYQSVTPSRQTHLSKGGRCSSSGGVSGIDLFLDFISLDHGAAFSNVVAESLCYAPIRLVQKSVDTGSPSSMSILHPIVSKAIAAMENMIEYPASPSALAKDLGISTRQLERLFKRYIGTSPKRHYMQLRLREAYRLLVQSQLGITQVALACGFASPSHFSKCFKAEFFISPFEFKRAKAE